MNTQDTQTQNGTAPVVVINPKIRGRRPSLKTVVDKYLNKTNAKTGKVISNRLTRADIQAAISQLSAKLETLPVDLPAPAPAETAPAETTANAPASAPVEASANAVPVPAIA